MAGTPHMLRSSDADEYRGLGGLVRIFSDLLPAQTTFLAVGEFAPGEGLRRHYHAAPGEEFYYLVRGAGTVSIAEETVEVTSGTCLYVPPEVVHGVTNTGTETLEIVFAVSPKDKAAPIEV
jgi:mannose-6-phosphate isomerase-like protein (cupin superfamily)